GVLLKELVVFPQLLQERSEDGKRIVVIHDNLRLKLQKASVLAESVLVAGITGSDTEPRKVNGRELEKNLYEDREKLSSVIMLESKDGVALEGVLSEYLTIKPVAVTGRTSWRGIPHIISSIEQSELNIVSDMGRSCIARNLEKVTSQMNGTNVYRQAAPLLAVAFELFVLVDTVYGTLHKDLLGYLLSVLNAVKLRYSLMVDPIVALRVVGMYRLTESEEAQIYRYSYPYVLAEESLRRLQLFVQWRPVFGRPDLFYMFVG
ncbi:unnamed protein product, partial [Ixodes hexagonus]